MPSGESHVLSGCLPQAVLNLTSNSSAEINRQASMFMTSTLGTPQQVVEWCASKPSSPEVAAECGTHLSPEQLSQVMIGKCLSILTVRYFKEYMVLFSVEGSQYVPSMHKRNMYVIT